MRYKGTELHAMSEDERTAFRREVQAIFQDPFDVFNPFYKVDRVLLKPLRNFGIATSRRMPMPASSRLCRASGFGRARRSGAIRTSSRAGSGSAS